MCTAVDCVGAPWQRWNGRQQALKESLVTGIRGVRAMAGRYQSAGADGEAAIGLVHAFMNRHRGEVISRARNVLEARAELGSVPGGPTDVSRAAARDAAIAACACAIVDVVQHERQVAGPQRRGPKPCRGDAT